MTSKTCDRCGRTLGTELGPDMPVQFEATGETICGECMLKMLESVSPPVDDNYEVREFKKKAADQLAQLTGVPVSKISLTCKQFVGHDVEVKVVNNAYQIMLLYDLIQDGSRWRQSLDYLVSWMRQHPLSNRTWGPQTSKNHDLVTQGRFVFIFLPEGNPEPPSNFGPQVAQELCRGIDASKIGWMVCPVSTASQERLNQEIGTVLNTWARTQSHPESLRVNVKTVKFRFSPEDCTCLIVQR